MLQHWMAFAVTLSMLWHAIVGCCAHHEHRLSKTASPAAMQECAHHCHGRQQGEQRDGALPAPAGGNRAPAGCDEASCVMTATDESRVVVAPDDSLARSIQPESWRGCLVPYRAIDEGIDSDVDFHAPGPWRRHLVLRVFLI